MGNLLKLIAKLFGKNAMAKTIGTRTNVIKLPNNEIKRYIKKDLNIEAASDEAVMNAKKEMEELLPDLPKMNDMERLVFEGNLRRLDNRINPPMAEVVEFGTKEKVTPEGITSLIKEKGQKAPPGTVMGNLESRVKQLEASGKSLEELTKGKGMTLDDIMSGALESQQGAKQLQREGLVRATARDIITADVKSGKLKLPKELQQDMLEGGGEPIDVLRRFYGEDALEVLDSLTPEFSKLRTSTEAADLAKSKFKFEPDVKRPPGTIEDMPEEFSTGGRVGYMGGGSTGLDYLMGIDRTNYQNGGMTLQQLQAKAPPGEFLAYINPEEAGVLKALGGSGKKINGIPSFFASGPGDTGGAGGADGAGGNDEGGGGGSGDTGDMGSEAANAAATAAGAASVGVGGIGGFGDPGFYSGTRMGNFGRNVANMARANPISSMVASAVLGPIGSLALNAARAYGAPGTTQTTEDTTSGSDQLIRQAIADPLGLNAAARDMSGVDALQQQYRANLGYQSGGRVGFKDGSKLPKEKTTLPINPMMDEGVDLNKRGFLKGAAGVGAGIAALGTGALRLARKGAKKIKDIDIDVGVAMDGDYDDYLERAVASYNTIFNIKANTKAGKKLLDKLAKEKKIVKEKDGTYSADTMGDINSPTIDALQDIKNKSSYNLSFEGNTFKNTDEASEYLRNKYSPLRDDRYNESFLSEDMEEVVDILAPKSAKEVIKERADLIEKTLKQRGDFASGGLSYLQGL